MHRTPVLIAALAAGAAAAHGAELTAECRPLMAAMEKSIQTDHTTTTTHGAQVMKGVTVGGAIYVQSHGAWVKSPITVQDNLAMSRENLKDATEFSCKLLPDSVIDGTPVTNYATHNSSPDTVMDSRIAIAKGTGLAVRVENRPADDPGGTMVTTYSYGNVKAPI